MKKNTILLLSLVLLIWAVPVTTQAQRGKDFTAADADLLFKKMQGTHLVKTMIWQPDQVNFFNSTGSVRYSRNENKILHEEFEIIQPDGVTQQVKGMLRYDEEKEHFEFVQFNPKGNAIVMMRGKWDPDFSMIHLDPIKHQWQLNGKRRKQQLQIRYIFFASGSFKKVLLSPDNTSPSFIVTDYHCLQHNVAQSQQP
ncbi:hypothetical protein ACFS7Z_14580 [Pontibacter toksunensis]|uniref:Outer membrane lipoprotein carrier protein LolA n=1 Tax=Pontibacter toksunensis TaxID=1332631 RepID=A0ABW6BYY5_9BACT